MQLFDDFMVVSLRTRINALSRYIGSRPICLDFRWIRCIVQRKNVRCRKLIDVVIDRIGRRHIGAAHVSSKGVAIDPSLKSWKNTEGLQLRSKNEMPVDSAIVKRLDADAIAHEEKPALVLVP